MKKPPKKLDLHHETRQLGRLELTRAVGGAMMAYAVADQGQGTSGTSVSVLTPGGWVPC